jgi:hypothetical protein
MAVRGPDKLVEPAFRVTSPEGEQGNSYPAISDKLIAF